ncbi:class I SAM-dependent methyltransferase [Ferdinandcohnia sp. Marseille-Q9671]
MGSLQTTKDNWNASLYDTKHSFVSAYGNSLIELVNPTNGERILDLGCGTGDLANKLHEMGVKVLGVDKSENMIKQASQKYPHLSFQVHDATNLDFECEFDAVFSNATLHWVKPALNVLHTVHKSLKQGGRFVAEFGGKGNVQSITNELIQQIRNAGFEYQEQQFPWFYPSIAEYSTLMEEAGFRVTLAQHYDRPTPLEGENGLRNWITMFADQMFQGVSEDAKNDIITNVEINLKESLFNGESWIADYKRIRVIGSKE